MSPLFLCYFTILLKNVIIRTKKGYESMLILDKKDNNHIYFTRGDTLLFNLIVKDENGKELSDDDIVTFAIYKYLNKPAVILENFNPKDGKVTINIPSKKMKIGELINLPRDYFYEITVNGVSTIQGYTNKKKSTFTLLPEGSGILGGENDGD